VESLLNGFAVEICACHTGQPTRIQFTVPPLPADAASDQDNLGRTIFLGVTVKY
jgi:hypothetical protein